MVPFLMFGVWRIPARLWAGNPNYKTQILILFYCRGMENRTPTTRPPALRTTTILYPAVKTLHQGAEQELAKIK